MATLILYSVSDSPPTLAVRLALKALNIEYNLVDIDFAAGEHLTDDYAKVSITVTAVQIKELPI